MVFEEGFELPKCSNCRQPYDDYKVPMLLHCGHGVCKPCLDQVLRTNRESKCPSCKETIERNIAPFRKNYQLQETLASLRKVEREKKKIQVKCSECNKVEFEKSMYSCITCTTSNGICNIVKEEEKLKIEGEPAFLENIRSIAVCANCSIANHLKKQHDVVEFFSILCTQQFDEHSLNLKFIRLDFEQMVGDFKKKYMDSKEQLEKSLLELDRMKDIIKTAKSSAIQQKIVKKASDNSEYIAKFITMMVKTVASLSAKLKSAIDEAAEETKKQNTDECLETVEKLYALLISSSPPPVTAPPPAPVYPLVASKKEEEKLVVALVESKKPIVRTRTVIDAKRKKVMVEVKEETKPYQLRKERVKRIRFNEDSE